MNQNMPDLQRQADIDIGYDYVFEHRWARFERVIWGTLGVIIALGIAGVFGRGPLNNVKRTLPDGTFVQYERVIRFKSPTVLTFQLPVSNGVARLEATTAAARKAGLQQIVPTPTQDLGSEHIGPIQFQASSPETKTVFVELAMQPSGIGPVLSKYSINNTTTLDIRQFVLP